jgi:hypothetical protein
MRHKRLKLSSVLLLAIGLTGLHAQNLMLKQIAGGYAMYNLGNIKKISFSSGNALVMKTASTSLAYALSGIRHLVFPDVITGIENQVVLHDETKASLYPNPAADYFILKLSEDAALNGKVDILSIDGRVVQSNQITGSHTPIDIQGLNKGIYFCRYTREGKSQTIKFIKQ